MIKVNKNFILSFNKDYDCIIRDLIQKGIIKEFKGNSINDYGRIVEITREDRSSDSNILYKDNLNIDSIMDKMLENHEYNILFYDRGIIQYDFTIQDGMILKERLIFVKKHNILMPINEINEMELDSFSGDWFNSLKGIPVVIRIDFERNNSSDVYHPMSHMTISNYKDCRIPLLGPVSLYNFINFILNYFYNDKLDFLSTFVNKEITLSENDKSHFHLEW